MRKSIAFIFLAFAAAILIIMQPSSMNVAFAEGRTLTAPQGLALTKDENGTYLVWGNVIDNVGYVIEIDGNETQTAMNVVKYDVSSLSKGVVHKTRVKALAGDGNVDSAFSDYFDLIITAKIDTPISVGIDNLILSWDEVKLAEGYKVTVNGVIIEQNTKVTLIDLSDYLNSTGDYSIRIKALGDNQLNLDSDYSVPYIYTHTKKLDAPSNLAVVEENNSIVASWDEVDYANGYKIMINGNEYETGQNNMVVTDYVSEIKNYSIKVCATGEGNFITSEYGNEVEYASTATIENPVFTVNGNTISWNQPTGASKYAVIVRDVSGSIFENLSYSGNSLNMEDILSSYVAGEYIVEIQALKNGNYNASGIVSTSFIKKSVLASPVLSLDGSIVSWGAIENSTGYSIFIDNRLRDDNLNDTSYDLTNDFGEVKSYSIKVIANGGGWYESSLPATVEFDYTGKLGTPDVTCDNLILNWTAVLGAKTYAVTVNGEIVDNGIELLTFDLSNYCNQTIEYTVSVYAEATDGYFAGDEKSITVTGQASQTVEEYKTYRLVNGLSNEYELFVDGEKSDLRFVNNLITLPATAKKIIIAVKTSQIENVNAEGQRIFLFSECDLSTATTVNDELRINIDNVMITETGEGFVTEEGLKSLEFDGKQYFYYANLGSYIPSGVNY